MTEQRRMDLDGDGWQVVGWGPNAWLWGLGGGNPEGLAVPRLEQFQCTPLLPAVVPGAVQEDLLRAGWLPDWNVGLNASACEWVEHRHWEYRRTVEVPAEWAGQRIVLRADGLDYAGSIVVDGAVVAEFSGMMTPHTFDLTASLTPGAPHLLSIIFFEAPPEQGQIGYSSRSRWFKARFAYQWDWCPRMVPLGIWDHIALEARGPVHLAGCLPAAQWQPETHTGRLGLHLLVETAAARRLTCRVTLRDGQQTIHTADLPCVFSAGGSETRLEIDQPLAVEPWWPNGLGDQRLYDLEVQLLDADNELLDVWSGHVGFKQVRWLPCEGAPANAEPWICEVNGCTTFLAGVNWTPVRMTYGSVTREMYAERLDLYAEAGMNILRVWGGAFLEKREFYELCDARGLMVWQEFPISSSGVDNMPPRDPEVLAELSRIATSHIWRRGGHAALLVWSGGNELFSEETGPVDALEPAISLMAGLCARLTPQVRFVSTSPSGPRFSFDPSLVGQGMHHDIHGPWQITGSLDDWRAFWDSQDGLLHSEVGAPSCSSVEIIQRYAGDLDLWPPSIHNPLWHYRQPWWLLWDRLAGEHGFDAALPELERFVAISQAEQAEALGYLMASAKRRFPRCGGVMIWMGHDCYPCLSNTSIIDFDGQPKPALCAIQAILTKK